MKKFNVTTKEFEDYTKDMSDYDLITQLEKDGVPYEYSSHGLIIADKDLTAANTSKNKVSF